MKKNLREEATDNRSWESLFNNMCYQLLCKYKGKFNSVLLPLTLFFVLELSPSAVCVCACVCV
jgi:hypothetical protein